MTRIGDLPGFIIFNCITVEAKNPRKRCYLSKVSSDEVGGEWMRRNDRELNNEQAMDLLAQGEYGVLGTAAKDGAPYTVPLNYCVVEERVYFHCAVEGFKIECIEANPKVSFCIVGRTEVLPDKFTTLYESCIVRGTAQEAYGDEKRRALEGLIAKYSAEYCEDGMRYIETLSGKTRVFGISIESITGKSNRG